MTSDSIKDILRQIEKLMYGFNYEVTLGCEVFPNCETYNEVEYAVKLLFPQSNVGQVQGIESSFEEFWGDINDTFDYRGDELGVSLKLNEKQEHKLRIKQEQYKDFISRYIDHATKIYRLDHLEGIPGYPVFWQYRYIIIGHSRTGLLVYGSASD